MRSFFTMTSRLAFSTFCLVAMGCDSHSDPENDEEVVTTIALTFQPAGGGALIAATWNDPDAEGGSAPVIDPIVLPPGVYVLSVKMENRLVTPPVDITSEVRNEAAEHQILFLGDAVNGPASNRPAAPLIHSYGDADANGLPVGLDNNTVTAVPGMGVLNVVLRHLPELNHKAVKVAGLAESVRTSGLGAIGGSSDVDVKFPVMVGSAP